MKPYVIVAFYKFVALSDISSFKEPLLQVMRQCNIKGTVILAEEGVNGGFCGFRENVDAMIEHFRTYPEFTDISFRETFGDENPFDKAKVKLRKEIVTLGQENINPAETTGIRLDPYEWNELIGSENVILIDTRNDYEVKLGTFEGSTNPETDNFRDFPEYVTQHLADQKDKKIAMFCTGGIRCEKSTAYLKKLGFEHVYQLDGGILNYLQTVPPAHSRWQGHCFVFDERVALDKNLESLTKGSIDSDWKNKNKKQK